MEHLEFEFNGGSSQSTARRPYSIAGVVASGNLEVMVEPKDLGGKCRFVIDTAAENFGPSWEAVIGDFMERRKPADLLFFDQRQRRQSGGGQPENRASL